MVGSGHTGNLSTTDTLGPENQFVMQRFPLFREVYFVCLAICLDPQKQSVIERFLLPGVSVTRDSTVLATYAHVVLELLLPVAVW